MALYLNHMENWQEFYKPPYSIALKKASWEIVTEEF